MFSWSTSKLSNRQLASLHGLPALLFRCMLVSLLLVYIHRISHRPLKGRLLSKFMPAIYVECCCRLHAYSIDSIEFLSFSESLPNTFGKSIWFLSGLSRLSLHSYCIVQRLLCTICTDRMIMAISLEPRPSRVRGYKAIASYIVWP